MTRRIKRGLLEAMTNGFVAPLWRPFIDDSLIVWMLHRFTDPEVGVHGASTESLRANLEFLRRSRVPLASLSDLLAAPENVRGTASARGPIVAFTVDDGYADFARIAAPIFAEFDCPVTVFVTTDPVDHGAWFWWDRIEFAVRTTTRAGLELDVGGSPKKWNWGAGERDGAINDITESLKLVPETEKQSALERLAIALEVDVPVKAPPRFAAMSWDDVRRCASLGVTFGPHTVTHPLLPQVSAAQSEWEIVESWRRLRAECDAAVPVFCFPNGSFIARDTQILAESDLAAALTTQPSYARRAAFSPAQGRARFEIPRFGYVDDAPRFRSIVTGFERVKQALARR